MGEWSPAPFNNVLILLITATTVRMYNAFAKASRALFAWREKEKEEEEEEEKEEEEEREKTGVSLKMMRGKIWE